MNNFEFLIYILKMVEKVNPNGELKQEMILVCNSIRNDLLHPNEYIRGRTLRMLMRVMHIGILEPLKPSILENITHTCPYVRRNCVALLYKIYLKFNGIKFEIFLFLQMIWLLISMWIWKHCCKKNRTFQPNVTRSCCFSLPTRKKLSITSSRSCPISQTIWATSCSS